MIAIFTTKNLSEWRDDLGNDDSSSLSHMVSIGEVREKSKKKLKPPEGGLVVNLELALCQDPILDKHFLVSFWVWHTKLFPEEPRKGFAKLEK